MFLCAFVAYLLEHEPMVYEKIGVDPNANRWKCSSKWD
jgi:hypothetical protein